MACKALYSCTAVQFCNTTRFWDLCDVFDFDTTVAAIRHLQPEGLCAILLVIDGFNYVVDQNKSMSREIVYSIGSYMASRAKQDNVVIFPVISGTVYGELQHIFNSSPFGHHLISLPPLSPYSIEAVFKHCLHAYAKWLDFMPFKRLLYLMAPTSHVLHVIIDIMETFPPELPPTKESIQSLASLITSELFARIANVSVGHLSSITNILQSNEQLQQSKGFNELLHFIFAGTPITLLQTSMVQLIHELEIQGIIYRHGDKHAPFLPYHLLIKANETYGYFHSTYPHPLVPVEFLPSPGDQFSWQMFKKLDHALDVSCCLAKSSLSNALCSQYASKHQFLQLAMCASYQMCLEPS